MKKISTITLLLMSFVVAQAQIKDKPMNLTFFGGYTEYAGDLGNNFLDFNKKDIDNNRVFGFSISRYLNSHFDLTAMGSYGTVSFNANGERKFKTWLTHGNLNLKYKFGLSDQALFKPFFFAGTGLLYHDNNGNENNTVNGVDWMPFTAGGGLTLQLTEVISLQYQITYGYWGEDDKDFVDGGTFNDAHLFNTLGVGFNLGRTKDADRDGVSDRRDRCPGTPGNAKVDHDGCPVDSDKDGIPDYQDKCITQIGTVAAGGCPDSDKDGVADIEDQCPNEIGSAALKGCPDTDADGIIDSKDRCPNVAGTLAMDGCPDRDGDGIRDDEDKCPDKAGTTLFNGCPDTDNDGTEDAVDMCPEKSGPVATNGCPDTDKDGLHDGVDKCPGTYGTAANQGCPEVKKEVKALFQKALQGIQFETGKAVIKPVSYPILNSIVKVMNDNPTYKLVIGGHTDNVGSDATNMTLSQNRADAVANYLITKGVSPLRVSATGYGASKPVDTNATKAGKARNRRVELKVEFIEVVSK